MPIPSHIRSAYLCTPALLFALCLSTGGCKTSAHSTDPHLKKIDEMVDAELPKGTSKSRVSYLLSTQGFRTEDSGKPRTLVAIVRKIDTDTLKPENARVTFHFDAKDQLESYDLDRAPDEPPQ